uniref:Uncharacterized protein n=1 Tax=Anguilla anguilla TaxID=7936 RepID=A0A0E9WL68_ANGAN
MIRYILLIITQYHTIIIYFQYFNFQQLPNEYPIKTITPWGGMFQRGKKDQSYPLHAQKSLPGH